MSEMEERLAAAFVEEHGADEDTAARAASKVVAFGGEYDEEMTADDLLEALEEAPYDDFTHNFDWVIGDFAAVTEDCTDSREYRLGGFGDLAADPEQGA